MSDTTSTPQPVPHARLRQGYGKAGTGAFVPGTLPAGRCRSVARGGRGGLALAVIAAFAFWGVRNVLGRQSALPAGALDG
jgi:hypothetical protein